MRLLLICLLLSSLSWAQSVEYERTTTLIPLKASSPVAQAKNQLAVQGSTVLLGDAQSNDVLRLPDMQLRWRLPPGSARLGADGTQVAIYRQNALEIYSQGRLSKHWKQPEPLWFGEVANQWVSVSA